jgi:hypothetical protein
MGYRILHRNTCSVWHKHESEVLDPWSAQEDCVDTFVLSVCLVVFDVFVDLGIMILPIPLVGTLAP